MKRFLILLSLLFCDTVWAQTETVKWYIDGQLYDTTTCQSGDNINAPVLSEKYGYAFQGWRPAIYDMSTLDSTINGTSSAYSNDDPKKWKVYFDYGTVYGDLWCSPTENPGSWYTNEDIDTTTEGRNCYCRITEFIPQNSNIVYGVSVSRWIFANPYGNCWGSCRNACHSWVKTNASFRSKLFGSN